MKLWVDDIRPAPADDWHIAKSVTEAIRALSNFDFEIISLDHDISHQVQVGRVSRPYPCEEGFSAGVIDWNPKIIIHSSNQIAGDEIRKILEDYGLDAEFQRKGLANRLEMEVG